MRIHIRFVFGLLAHLLWLTLVWISPRQLSCNPVVFSRPCDSNSIFRLPENAVSHMSNPSPSTICFVCTSLIDFIFDFASFRSSLMTLTRHFAHGYRNFHLCSSCSHQVCLVSCLSTCITHLSLHSSCSPNNVGLGEFPVETKLLNYTRVFTGCKAHMNRLPTWSKFCQMQKWEQSSWVHSGCKMLEREQEQVDFPFVVGCER